MAAERTKERTNSQDQYDIISPAAHVDNRTRVLKHEDTFALFDLYGDIGELTGETGIYHRDTRFLSRLVLRVEERRPLLLSSSIRKDNASLAVDLMNPDLSQSDGVAIPHGTVHFFRSKVLWQSTCHEQLRVDNFGLSRVNFTLSIELDADFADIFEVRGTQRERRGRWLSSQVEHNFLLLGYEGLDGRVRRTRISFDPAPTRLDESEACFDISLEPQETASYHWAICCELDATAEPSARVAVRYEQAARHAADAFTQDRLGEARVITSNQQFNAWLQRSIADLHMMRTKTAHGLYPYAGVPWYSTAFGRDGIITALQCLWFNPAIARGALQYLAATQADTENAEQDAQPGKIIHETRAGEMANLGEVPFGRYYGSVDSTPLFIMLAGAYYLRTGDVSFVRMIWPNVERALAWIRDYGDSDNDGFVDYARRSSHGLVQQGWKDSQDSVFHADGTLAKAPIAMCEVQGYVYAAKRAAATLAEALGLSPHAQELMEQAETLKRRFEEQFWCEELSTYALALDGNHQPCRVRTSNAGHCLFTGIADEDRTKRVAETLLDKASFSGWGVRTVAASEARYNPMSYHNGTVWPHDNALVGLGLARYGHKTRTAQILSGLFNASLFFDSHRLPELFCGFPRRRGESPTEYPVSCSPQTWAACAVFALLQACLGLEVRGPAKQVVFNNPFLPGFLKKVRINGLRLAGASLDVLLSRHATDVAINVLKRQGDVEVVVVK